MEALHNLHERKKWSRPENSTILTNGIWGFRWYNSSLVHRLHISNALYILGLHNDCNAAKMWLRNVISLSLRSGTSESPWDSFMRMVGKLKELSFSALATTILQHYQPIDARTGVFTNAPPSDWNHTDWRIIGNDAVKLMQDYHMV